MPKMILIEPRAQNLHIFSIFPLPRLGVFILGALLRDAGWQVEVMVEELAPVDWDKIFSADMVGISTITPTAPRAYAIADRIRERRIPVLMGGPHVSFLPAEAMEHADFVISGEGEQSLMDFIHAWPELKRLASVPGLSYREGGKIRHNKGAGHVKNLDALPYPDFSLFRGPGKIVSAAKAIPVQTSRGCPYDCSFCSVTPMFGRRYRFRSVEDVISELRGYHNHARNIFFYDDNFTANPVHSKRLLRAMIREGFRFRWSAQVRVEVAKDLELVSLMKEAGCHTLYIGFESINPDTLVDIKKKQNVEDIWRAIRVLRKHRIHIHGMFMLGFDRDDWHTVKETVRFTRRSKLTSVQFLILAPLPGTETYRELDRQKRILFKDWSLYDAHHVVFRPSAFTLPELQRAQIYGHRKFYSRWQKLKKLAFGNLVGFFINWYAHSLNKAWKRKNKTFMKVLELQTPNQIADILVDYRQKITLNLLDTLPIRGMRILKKHLQ